MRATATALSLSDAETVAAVEGALCHGAAGLADLAHELLQVQRPEARTVGHALLALAKQVRRLSERLGLLAAEAAGVLEEKEGLNFPF